MRESASRRTVPAQPRVSVTMPTYNVERYVGEAVQSILEQTFTDFELLVRDDGSTDATRAELERFHDSRLRVLADASHLGTAGARNRLLCECRGEYAAVMDADDVVLPEWLDRMVAFLDEHPEIGAVGCGVVWMNAAGEPMRVMHYQREDADIQRVLMRHNALMHTGALIRRACFDDVGGYREFLPCSEDYDLFCRIAEAWDLANVAEPLYQYRRYEAQTSQARRAEQLAWSDRLRQALRQRRVLGCDEFYDPATSPKVGRLNMERRTPADQARHFRIWSKGFGMEPWCDAEAAWACARRAATLAPTLPGDFATRAAAWLLPRSPWLRRWYERGLRWRARGDPGRREDPRN